MKRVNLTFLTAILSMTAGPITAATVPVGSALIPVGSGYGVGDSFQLVFVTSNATNMSDIETNYASTLNSGNRTVATFNAYVNDAADTSSITGIASLNWSAIVSTTVVDAKDNAVVSGPVHRVGDGVKVVDDAADMWDGNLDNLINTDESGNAPANWQVWSGTNTDGTESNGVDKTSTSYASSDGNWNDPSFLSQGQAGADPHWIDLAGIDTGDNRVNHVYALSEVITVTPEPGSLALMGLGGLLIVRRRRRG